MSEIPAIGDGLAAFHSLADPRAIAKLIGQLARWADPIVVRQLPVWHPETARKQPMFKKGWTERLKNNGKGKTQGNEEANRTLTRVLGVSSKERPNWSCCHIWGNDDPKFGSSHSEVNDPRYYSCPANMVLLPTPLKTFTDALPEVRAALRLTAHRLFGFLPEGRALPDRADAGDWLPEGWDQGKNLVVVQSNARIQGRMERRFHDLRRDFQEAQGLYPRQQVAEVAAYWAEKQHRSLFASVDWSFGTAPASP